MTTPRVIRTDAVPPQRWRNGGGWTRELLALPSSDDWRVRVSVADIESDGPFSAFPGVQRHFAVLHGAGVVLTIDGVSHRVAPGSASATFPGEAVTSCRLLDGPTRDLNLMVRDGHGALLAVVPGRAWAPRPSTCGLFATAAGRCMYGEAVLSMSASSLAWFDVAPASLAFDGTGWWLQA